MNETLKQISDTFSKNILNLLILIGVIVGALVLSFILFKLVSIFVKRLSGSSYTLINKHLSIPFRLLLVVMSITFTLQFTYFDNLNNAVLSKLVFISLLISISYFLVKVSEFIRDVIYEKFSGDTVNNLAERKVKTQVEFLQKASSMFIILIAISIGLMSFSQVRQLGTSILASAGIAGIIVGFAAQKSLSNLLAGLQIAFTQPIRIDDAVIVEGEFGRIEEITLSYVVINLWDSRRLIVPISYFLEKPFQNWTRTSADLLGSVFINVDFNLPIDTLREQLREILKEPTAAKLWDGRVSNVQVTDLTDTSMQIRILISARNSGNAFDLRCIIREKIVRFITENFPDALPKRRSINAAPEKDIQQNQ